ncbi:MAG TPA: imidazoleglycerol-phosphate dehydratase [Nitrososphaeraceae archaeon]|nr:imidazoleglycerol-phosphate dehydratase [Nitrososphaeraceae archaeon]
MVSSATTIERTAKTERITKETSVIVEVNIDGTGKTTIKTGLPFYDHLVASIGKHANIDIILTAESKDSIIHHLVEDISIALSQTIDKALGDRSNIMRFGYAMVPMDESLAYVTIDLVKRQFYVIQLKLSRDTVEGIPTEDIEHFIRSFAQNLNACTHIIVEYGDNDHHKIESVIKAFAVSLRMAASIDEKSEGVPSTKGAM